MKTYLAVAAMLVASACATTGDRESAAPDGSGTPDDAPPPSTVSLFDPDDGLEVCGGMTVSNAPPTNAARYVTGYKPYVLVEGVKLAVMPTNGACLSSGFGPRGSKTHSGVDYYSRAPGMIHAAGAGTVREAGYRDDFGNYVLIDHGGGVFTRYAHLDAIEPGIAIDAVLADGTPLGPMGNTSFHSLPIHLHYEVLSGDYDTPTQSFGLTPLDPFAYPFSD